MVYLKICQSMSQRMLNRAEILFFVLIARVSCFGAMYVSESMDLDSWPRESYWCITVLDVLEWCLNFKDLSKIFFKIT